MTPADLQISPQGESADQLQLLGGQTHSLGEVKGSHLSGDQGLFTALDISVSGSPEPPDP